MKLIRSLSKTNIHTKNVAGKPVMIALLLVLIAGMCGCGQSAKLPNNADTNAQVMTYFTGAMTYSGIGGNKVVIDHNADTIVISNLNQTIDIGSFTADSNGFNDVSFSAVLAGSQGLSLTPQNPPITGAWLMEIPGVGAMGKLYSYGTSPSAWVPAAMVSTDECPTNTEPQRFVYVMTPYSAPPYEQPAYFYGTVDISTKGSTIEFSQNYYAIDATSGNLISTTPTNLLSSGGCSETAFGHVIASPINSDPSTSEQLLRYSAIAKGQFLSGALPTVYTRPATYNMLGIALPSSSVTPSALALLQYRGLLHDPSNVPNGVDDTTSAVGFGDLNGTSAACSALTAALPPSASNVIYGGEYPNDNTNGTENCDIAIDLGTEDSTTHGFFPNATVYLAPGSLHNAGASLVSHPVVAVAGPVEGRNAIFLTYFGGTGVKHPLGIYLFQTAKN